MTAQAGSSAGSTPSVPATPTSLTMLELDPSIEPLRSHSSSLYEQNDRKEDTANNGREKERGWGGDVLSYLEADRVVLKEKSHSKTVYT